MTADTKAMIDSCKIFIFPSFPLFPPFPRRSSFGRASLSAVTLSGVAWRAAGLFAWVVINFADLAIA